MAYYFDDGDCQSLELKSLSRRITSPLRPDQYSVTFTFKFDILFRNFQYQQPSSLVPDFIGEDRLTDGAATVTMLVGSAGLDPATLERVLEFHYLLSDANRRWLLERALEEARDALRALESCACVCLDFELFLEENLYFYGDDHDDEDDDDDDDGVVTEADSSVGSAADSSIASLKEYVIGSGGVTDGCCSICLEEFPGRDEEVSGRERLLSMPCCHVFHGECIRRWLKISRYCPLCRYEMPSN